MPSVLPHWHLAEKPFEGVCDSRFFFESEAHREALARLRYLAEEETMMLGMLTGEIGCGKTMTLNRYASSIDPAMCVCLVFENSFFDMRTILSKMLHQLGLDGPYLSGDFGQCYEYLDQSLDQLRDHYQRHLLCIFDEAQDMDDKTLAGICRLSNLNRDGGRRISIVLVGQPELRDRVGRIPALDQRISLRFHLGPLRSDEVPRYLDHRIRVAGGDSGVFQEKASTCIFTHSRGIPREMNRLAKLAMEDVASRAGHTVGEEDIQAVVRDLQHHHPAIKTQPRVASFAPTA